MKLPLLVLAFALVPAAASGAPEARAALGYLTLVSPAASLLVFPAGARHAEKDGWLDDTLYGEKMAS
jgi:hypothetical protein